MVVYAIIHKTEKDHDPENDGCGFIIVIDGSPVFVTCKHNFTNNEGTDSHILIDGNEVKIGPGVKGFYMDEFDGSKTYRLSKGSTFLYNDYAFQELDIPIDELDISQLADPSKVKEHKPLFLNTIDIKSRKQLRLQSSGIAKHNGMEENIWRARCTKAEKGHSGGAVGNLDDEIIGLLCTGIKGWIRMIKSETLVPFYNYLKQ